MLSLASLYRDSRMVVMFCPVSATYTRDAFGNSSASHYCPGQIYQRFHISSHSSVSQYLRQYRKFTTIWHCKLLSPKGEDMLAIDRSIHTLLLIITDLFILTSRVEIELSGSSSRSIQLVIDFNARTFSATHSEDGIRGPLETIGTFPFAVNKESHIVFGYEAGAYKVWFSVVSFDV